MISNYYQRNAKKILITIGVTLLLVWHLAETIPPNNNTESWISSENVDRKTYEDFRHHFGGEELVLIALDREQHSAQFIESLSSRLESLDEIRKVWNPLRLTRMMSKLGVPEEEIETRLRGVSVSEDGKLAGVAAILTPQGLADRTVTMRRVNEVLEFCGLQQSQVKMAGAPVIVAELDRLGGKEANRKYFILTMAVCFGILWFLLKQIIPAALILLEITWAFQMTLAIVNVCGGEMNFILDSLPVMIMAFTMAIAIHYIYHAASFVYVEDAIGKTLKIVFLPCLLAMITTAIGLLSLTINDIPPVKQFGFATAGGTVIAFIAGLFVTPAVLQLFPPVHLRQSKQTWQRWFEGLATFLDKRRVPVMLGVFGLLVFSGIGLNGFRAEFQPLKFFPETSKVLIDNNDLRSRMANTDSVEVIVDFGVLDLAPGEQIDIIREIVGELLKCDRVPIVVSGVSWLPHVITSSTLVELNRFKNDPAANEFVADGGSLWRLSARIDTDDEHTQQAIFDAISRRMIEVGEQKNLTIRTTGIAPLIVRAQADIFWGFWTSVGAAICFITLIMIATLKSLRLGILAMIPNVTPLLLVFGSLGWLGIATDIGTMMTGSIALGIAVDGTFHFLTAYSRSMKKTGNNRESTLTALAKTGPPIVQATIVTGVGMLALMLSNFGPTGNFGLLMSVSLAVALIGDLILLPCLLLVFGRDKKNQQSEQHDHPNIDEVIDNSEELLELDISLELDLDADDGASTIRPFLAATVLSSDTNIRPTANQMAELIDKDHDAYQETIQEPLELVDEETLDEIAFRLEELEAEQSVATDDTFTEADPIDDSDDSDSVTPPKRKQVDPPHFTQGSGENSQSRKRLGRKNDR
jgi:predicted RND superfamily exporter protein